MTDQAIDRMKQAVRENRRGKIAVATFWAHEGAIPELALLRARMEVCERIAHDTRHAVWFIGYAPEFDALKLGERPPEYEAIIARGNDGAVTGMTFRRIGGAPVSIAGEEFKDEGLQPISNYTIVHREVSIDPRIEEFRAAGREWLRRIHAGGLSGRG